MCQATEPVIIDYRCHRALREAWGFLKGTGNRLTFSCNPYYGCGFNCSYCYAAKAEIMHHGGPGMDLWGKYVFAKTNFPQILDRELRHLQIQGILQEAIIRISSTTDAYQDAERSHHITRRAFQCLAKHRPRWIFVQTKSTLILRDVKVLTPLDDHLVISITVTTDNDATGRLFESNALLNSERIKVIQKLHAIGFHVEAMIAPVLPQDSRHLAEVLSPHVDRVFIKNFYESGVNGKWVRDEALWIIREKGLGQVLKRVGASMVKD